MADPRITQRNFLDAVAREHGAIPSGFRDERLTAFARGIEGLGEAAQAQRTLDHVRAQFGRGALPASITAAELMRLDGMSREQREAYVKAKAGPVTLRDGTPIPWEALEAYQRGDRMPMARALGMIGPAENWRENQPNSFYRHRSEAEVRREIESSAAMRTVRMYQGLESNPVVREFQRVGEQLRAMRDYSGRATLAEMHRLTGGRTQDRDIGPEIRAGMLTEISQDLARAIPDVQERRSADSAFASLSLRELAQLTPRVIASTLRDEMIENQIERDLTRGATADVTAPPAPKPRRVPGPEPQ